MIPVMIATVLDGYSKLQNMLDSVDFPVEHIIIMDNGGKLKNATCEFAKELSIINMPYNTGISIPYNLGIKLTPMSKYWLLTQDDVIWIPGGLEKIHSLAGSDTIGLGLKTDRPFACRVMGENVVAKVGLLDESYFPAPGDDFNYHKRCHYHNIEEVDISGTYIAELSGTIKKMVNNGSIPVSIWNTNFYRSLFGPPMDVGWNLSRRRSQSLTTDSFDKETENLLDHLSSSYIIHTEFEDIAFKKGIMKL